VFQLIQLLVTINLFDVGFFFARGVARLLYFNHLCGKANV